MKILLLVFCLLVSQNLFAINTIQLSIEQLLFDYRSADSKSKENLRLWQLDKLNIELDFSSEPMTLNLNLAEINFPEPFRNLSSLKLICKDFSLNTFSNEENSMSCHTGEILANHSFLKKPNAKNKFQPETLTPIGNFSFKYNFIDNTLVLDINELKIDDGFISLNLNLNSKQWELELKAQEINYFAIKDYLDFYLDDSISNIEVITGHINLMANMNGEIVKEAKKGPGRLVIHSVAAKGNLNNISYIYKEDLAENLSFNFDFSFENSTQYHHHKTQKSQINFTLDNISGEIIQNNIYLFFKGSERLQSTLTILQNKNNQTDSISLTSLDISLPEIMHFKSSGKLSIYPEPALKNLNAYLKIIDYEQLNQLYLKDALEGSNYEGLEISGKSEHTIKVNSLNSRQHIDIKSELSNLSFSFEDKIAFDELDADINWNNLGFKSAKDSSSHLSWKTALLNNLPLGQTSIHFITHQNNISLTQTAHIPVFDGELQIDSLDITHIGQTSHSDKKTEKDMTMVINGLIKPISLKLISEHFSWPILHGKLSAIIPTTRYNEHQFIIGGAMMLQVFDGFIILKDLEIEHPLEDFARLESNIDIKNLNLKDLTKTYDFGEIQGRIDGHLSNLVLESWRPIAFNASLQTPANDKSPHRISQRAIDNLSSLGGVSGLLSKSFLSFFKTFGYHKIGISCQLANKICRMAGVEPKGDGYYIVKGGGIPRIDVIGFEDHVDWEVLVSRLKAIQSANQAVIQ